MEDDTSLRHAIKTKLENSVYSLSEVIEGEEGIKIALRLSLIILLYILMPRVDGVKVLETLRIDE